MSVNKLHLFFHQLLHLKNCPFLAPTNPSCMHVVSATTAYSYLQTDTDFERTELKEKDKTTYKSQTFVLNMIGNVCIL